MHDSNHKDEFEEYLQDQVSEHRMYPSDRVWKNIRNSVHTPKKWPALSIFAILIISALIIGTILNKPVPDSITPNFVFSLQSPANIEAQKTTEVAKNSEQIVDNNYSISQLTTRTIIDAVEKIKIDEAVSMQLQHTNNFNASANVSVTNLPGSAAVAVADGSARPIKDAPTVTMPQTASNSSISVRNIDSYLFDITSRLRSILNSEPVQTPKGGVAFFSSGKNDIAYDNFDLRVPHQHKDLLPSLNQLGKNSSRFDFRFYVTPSISYRRLKEENSSSENDKTSGASLESDYRVDPSVAINHSAAMGYETGLGLGYKLNNSLSLVGGFQFNISQYKINAFLYKDEPTAVTLDKGEYASIVNTISSLRSVSGTEPLTIKNRYYQISMPIGIEWNILNRGRLSWGLGASAQPTYTFDKQPLIISSNYKNYADGSAYVRNWNVNANVETFLGYSMGTYRWQIGPQLRYQMLPSLVDKYPNKEYLFNYGLKVGIVKKLK
jgi:hypothetical protein